MGVLTRRAMFENRARSEAGAWAHASQFGYANIGRFVDGGLLLGVPNQRTTDFTNKDGFLIISAVRLGPEDEAYIAVYIRDVATLKQRLADMLARGKAGDPAFAADINNVRYYLASDGLIYLFNKVPDDSPVDPVTFNLGLSTPGVRPDKILCAVYPPDRPIARRIRTREFVQYLQRLTGADKVQELGDVWPQASTVPAAMSRTPAAFTLLEIQKGIAMLGGHYAQDLLERFHVALNHLTDKHFVILSGTSGTGKTGLVERYARAVHGLNSFQSPDPFFFNCAVRPDWTDPSGLTGYYDVITDTYIVPPFLRAVLTADAHPSSPVFVLVDEMNLARVEYYFADVLSAMETSEHKLHLHSFTREVKGSTGEVIPPEVYLRSNLYIIGTINVDESTQSISDKVLDRAVCLDMSTVDLAGYGAALKAQSPTLAPSVDACLPLLSQLNVVLTLHRQGFGYRIAREFVEYHAFALKLRAGSLPTAGGASDTATPTAPGFVPSNASSTIPDLAAPIAAATLIPELTSSGAPAAPSPPIAAVTADALANASQRIIDHQVVQKILVKLRGGEREQKLLDDLESLLKPDYPQSLALIQRFKADLEAYYSFQGQR